MKSILIIGVGQFGKVLAQGLLERNNQVMLVDVEEDNIAKLLPLGAQGKIADCTNPKVLKELGVSEYDMCFVCLGDAFFKENLEITTMLKENDARYVVSKSNHNLHSRVLLKVGADEVIYPDKEIAEACAVKYSSESIFNCIQITPECSVYEIAPIKKWIGKTLATSNIRQEYKANVIAIKYANGDFNMNPGPNDVITEDIHLHVFGAKVDLDKIAKKFSN